MWAGPKALKARADLEVNVVPAAVKADKDSADPVEAAEQSLAAGVVGLAAVQEAALAVGANSAAEAAGVFFASK
jgi:hypothetical protein